MDNKYVLTGFSAGELTSKENLIILEGKDIVDSYVKNFESLWEEFKDNSVDIQNLSELKTKYAQKMPKKERKIKSEKLPKVKKIKVE